MFLRYSVNNMYCTVRSCVFQWWRKTCRCVDGLFSAKVIDLVASPAGLLSGQQHRSIFVAQTENVVVRKKPFFISFHFVSPPFPLLDRFWMILEQIFSEAGAEKRVRRFLGEKPINVCVWKRDFSPKSLTVTTPQKERKMKIYFPFFLGKFIGSFISFLSYFFLRFLVNE